MKPRAQVIESAAREVGHPTPTQSSGGTWARLLLVDPVGGMVCALVFLGLTLGAGLTYLHDEGFYTFDLTRGLIAEPGAFFFYHKAKPPLLLLYALPAYMGVRAYLIASALVGALTVLLVCGAARALGLARPNLAGWVMATSTAFAIMASNGTPNADGAFFLALFLFLYFTGRRRWAALVLGLLPLVRYELGAVVAIFMAYDVWRRRDIRFLLWVAAAPTLYVLAGAVYHRDLLWVPNIAYSLQLAEMEAALKTWSPVSDVAAVLHFLGASFVLNSPVLLPFCLLGCVIAFRRRHAAIGAVAVTAISIYGAITLFQVSGLQLADMSPRNHLAPLPLLALLCAHGLSIGGRGPWERVLVLLVGAALGWHSFFLNGPAARLDHLDQHRETHALVEELRERGIYRGQPVYSDRHVLRYDPCAGLEEVHVLANDAMLWELSAGTTQSSGQRDAVFRGLRSWGLLMAPDEHRVERGAIYIIEDHPRSARWQARVDSKSPSRELIGDYVVSHWR